MICWRDCNSEGFIFQRRVLNWNYILRYELVNKLKFQWLAYISIGSFTILSPFHIRNCLSVSSSLFSAFYLALLSLTLVHIFSSFTETIGRATRDLWKYSKCWHFSLFWPEKSVPDCALNKLLVTRSRTDPFLPDKVITRLRKLNIM